MFTLRTSTLCVLILLALARTSYSSVFDFETICDGKTSSKCAKKEGCAYVDDACTPDGSVAFTAPPTMMTYDFDIVCDTKTKKKKCKKEDGCAWEDSQCVHDGSILFTASPTSAPTIFIDTPCNSLKKKKCKKEGGCEYTSSTCIPDGSIDFENLSVCYDLSSSKCGKEDVCVYVNDECVEGDPTDAPTTDAPTAAPTTLAPTAAPTTLAPTAAPTASVPFGDVLPVRCPTSAPYEYCEEDPCTTIPACPDSLNEELTCVQGNCGGCVATWYQDGRPFSCPEASCVFGEDEDCCEYTSRFKDDCSEYTCDLSLCPAAESCGVDECLLCAPIYFDIRGAPLFDLGVCRFGYPDEETGEVVFEYPSGDFPETEISRPPNLEELWGSPVPGAACDPATTYDCCPGGYFPEICSEERALQCTVLVYSEECPIALCGLDPCEECALIALDENENSLDAEVCVAVSMVLTCPFDYQCPNITPDCGELPDSCADLAHDFECKMDECDCVSLWYDNTQGDWVLNIRYAELGVTCLPEGWGPVQFDCNTIYGGVPCPDELPLITEFDWFDEFDCAITEDGYCRAYWEPKCHESCATPTDCAPAPPGTWGDDVDVECIALACTCEAIQLPVGCELDCELQCGEIADDALNFWVGTAIEVGIPEELHYQFECIQTEFCSCDAEFQPLWVLLGLGA